MIMQDINSYLIDMFRSYNYACKSFCIELSDIASLQSFLSSFLFPTLQNRVLNQLFNLTTYIFFILFLALFTIFF